MIARSLIVPILFLIAALSRAQTGPVINAVAGAADNWSAFDFGLARGSLFTIYGTDLAPSVASPPGLPLPTSLNGVKVTVSTNYQFVDAPLLYVSPNQINAILPSAVQEGTQFLTAEVNGVVSNETFLNVTTSRFAAFTRSQLGFGPAVLQQYNGSGASLNSLMHPAAPGHALVLWGTGLGPLPSGSDAQAPGVVNLASDVVVSVGGTLVKPFYAGRAPQFPGLDQINFYLPSTVPAGCYVPITVSVSGEAQFEVLIQGTGRFSSPPTLSVGTSDSPCASEFGLSSALVERLDQGGTVRVAALSFDSETGQQSQGVSSGQVGQTAQAWVSDYDAANLSLLATGWQSQAPAPAGSCERQAYNGPITPQISAAASLISQDGHGALSNGTTLGLKINGANGCSWNTPSNSATPVYAMAPDNCPASSYSLSGSAGNVALFSMSGSLPAPRQWSPSDQVLLTSQSGGSLQAAWSLTDLQPDDQLTLDLSSSQYTGSIPILPTGFAQDSLTCGVSPAGNSFLAQPDDVQWLRTIGDPSAVIQAAQVSFKVFSGSSAGIPSPAPVGAPDVFLLLIGNRLSGFLALP